MATIYQAIGGSLKCRELSAAFYDRVARDPLLRPLFPGKSLRCAIEEFTAFLVQFLGGPPEDTQRRWWLSLRESHLRFQIGSKERDAWLRNMREALLDVQMEEPARSALESFFQNASAYVVNTGDAIPAGQCVHEDLAQRWRAQLALDLAVEAIRKGEVNQAVALAESFPLEDWFKRYRSVHAHFTGLLIGAGHWDMADYAVKTLAENRDLIHEHYNGRTLLHAAAAAGNLRIVELLLRMGADPNSDDSGGHTPLYSVGNECTTGGGDVVRFLVRTGAEVDACNGVKHCTPLHMAARRGNVEVTEALLDCGANIEARDSLGDTPLRRAVNCGKTAVAELLVAKGADTHSTGSKGFTPRSAARAGAIRRLAETWD